MMVTRREQQMTFWRGLVVSCFCFCFILSSRLFIFLSFEGGLSFPELGGLSFLGLSFPDWGVRVFLSSEAIVSVDNLTRAVILLNIKYFIILEIYKCQSVDSFS